MPIDHCSGPLTKDEVEPPEMAEADVFETESRFDADEVIVPLVRVSIPATLVLLPSVIPPEPFNVKFLILPLNIDAGKVIPLELVKAKVAELLLASILPDDRTGEFPDKVSVLAPTVNVPADNVNVPATFVEAPSVTPPVPFNVRLLILPVNRDAGNVTPLVFVKVNVAELLLALILPEVREGAELPERVSVFAPIDKVPDVRVRVPPTLADPPKAAPVLLLTVRLLNVDAGTVCALLPSKVTVPPQVNPLDIGVPDVFCILIVPELLTLVRLSVLVPIFRVPPAVVFNVVAVMFPFGVSVPLVLSIVNIL